MKHAVAILDAPGIIFTTDSIQFNNKTILYSDVDYGKSNDRVRFIYDTVNNHSFEQSFDTKKVKATPHNYTMNLRIRGTFSECLYCP